MAAGGTITMNPPSSYPQNSAGAKYPFPQGHKSQYCAFPVYNTDSIASGYNTWKAKFYQNGHVIRPDSNNDIVSEGIAYGMLIGVYMNDKPMFDALWAFAQSKFDGNGLMNWHLDTSGNVIGSGGATDADEDMAWALLMADTQWGGSYLGQATTLIGNIFTHEVENGSNVLKPGDNFGGASQTNPSYFAPSYYRVFAKVGGQNWNAVVDSSYTILNAASGADGLVPNWVNSSGSGINGPGSDPSAANGPYFGYDACRIPFRIGLDYCENGEARAKTYLDKLIGFFAGLPVVFDGYTVSGTNPTGTLGDNVAGMAFYGPAAVGAMSGSHPTFLATAYHTIEYNSTVTSQMAINGVYTYFQASWGMLGLLGTSGNFWDLRSP